MVVPCAAAGTTDPTARRPVAPRVTSRVNRLVRMSCDLLYIWIRLRPPRRICHRNDDATGGWPPAVLTAPEPRQGPARIRATRLGCPLAAMSARLPVGTPVV